MAEKVFVGVHGTVVALDASTGTELWRTKLKGSDFVNVALTDRAILAGTKGEVFALEPSTGTVIWNNRLKGLGLSFVTFAGSDQGTGAAAGQRRKAGAAGAA